VNRQPANRHRASLLGGPAGPAEQVQEQKPSSGLRIVVVSTTVPATLAALRRAGELAHELGARIRILVPHVVPYPLPIDRPLIDPNFMVRHFRTISVHGAIETRIDVCLCRDAYEAVARGLCPESVVLIGGRKRWWPTREQRLAKRLNLSGHHVVFVPHG
jgi:hypothetical protein